MKMKRRARAWLPRAGADPPLAHELAQRPRGVAVDHRLHIVERAIGHAAGIAATRLVGEMLARIPPALRDIQSADERNGIVDDDDLLVVRRINRVRRVEPEGKAAVRAPVELVHRQPFALESVEHREVPSERVDA
jgi:hypothetical protein